MTVASQEQGKGGVALYTAIVVFVIGLVILLFAAGINGATQGEGNALVTRVNAQPIRIQEGFETPVRVYGLVESPQVADISFDTGGQVVAVHYDEGDTVTEGDIVARLDTVRLVARHVELDASLERARADLTLANLGKKRVSALVAQKLESSQRLDEAIASAASASAQVKEIQAAIKSLQVEQMKAQLIAPFSGIVSARYIDEGSVVAAGTPLVNVTSNEPYQVRFAVPADIISLFSSGNSINVKVGNITIAGVVSQLSPIRNRQTRTIDILVELTSNDGVRPGDTAALLAEKHSTETGSWVPVSALSNGLRGLWRVFVVSDDGGATLETRTVEVVYTDGERAFVRGALSDGDLVVSNGTHKLSPGQSVSLNIAAGKGAGQ